MSKRKSERNREIYRLHTIEGLSSYEIAPKFNVTPPRITQIINAEKQLITRKGGDQS